MPARCSTPPPSRTTLSKKPLSFLAWGRAHCDASRWTRTCRLICPPSLTQVDADIAAGFFPLAVIATAGTTNSGAIDPIRKLADFCKSRKLWLHVDGAYGAALVLSNAHRDLLDGISEADSVTMDPHKWLAMPFAAGMLLTRHAALLEQTFGVETSYMPRIEHHDVEGKPLPPDYYRISAQWSRRMNSLKLWLTLRVHGRQAYEALMTRQMELARLLEEKARGRRPARGDFARPAADCECAAASAARDAKRTAPSARSRGHRGW